MLSDFDAKGISQHNEIDTAPRTEMKGLAATDHRGELGPKTADVENARHLDVDGPDHPLNPAVEAVGEPMGLWRGQADLVRPIENGIWYDATHSCPKDGLRPALVRDQIVFWQ